MTVETPESVSPKLFLITCTVAGQGWSKESTFQRPMSDRATAHQFAQGELATLIMANPECAVSSVQVVQQGTLLIGEDAGD